MYNIVLFLKVKFYSLYNQHLERQCTQLKKHCFINFATQNSIQICHANLGLLCYLCMCSFSETDYFNIFSFKKVSRRSSGNFISEYHFHAEWKKKKKRRKQNQVNFFQSTIGIVLTIECYDQKYTQGYSDSPHG